MSVLHKKNCRFARLAVALIFGALLLARSDVESGSLRQRAHYFTRALEFDYLSWSLDALFLKARQAALGAVDYLPEAAQKQLVLDYLNLVREIQQTEAELTLIYADPEVENPAAASVEIRQRLDAYYTQRERLAPLAESILQNQLNAVAAQMGLTLGGQTIPPVFYHVTPLPLALILSPRDHIEQIANISLQPGMPADARDALERQVDQTLGVSSLVVNIGGVGLYPTMVVQTADLNWLAEVIAHEWIHNYLTLRPLGVSYMSSPELRIMNETTAEIAGKELGAALIARYYPEFIPPPPMDEKEPEGDSTPSQSPPPFDFRAEMHITRVHVDAMLAAGEIEKAETYMELRRRFFWDHGYRIRKLNQAYFAFYGAYADRPGGAASAADPVGTAVRALRAQSDSLAEFVNRMSWLWSFEQLQRVVGSDVRLVSVPFTPWVSHFPGLQSLLMRFPDGQGVPGGLPGADERARCRDVWQKLTPAQKDALRALCATSTRREAAEELGISIATLDDHKTAIFRHCRLVWQEEKVNVHFLRQRFHGYLRWLDEV